MSCIGRCHTEGKRKSVSSRRFIEVLGEMGLDAIGAAERFGCSRSKVYGVLNGHDRLTMDMAFVLQERYGVSAGWLLALDEVKPPKSFEAAHDDGD